MQSVPTGLPADFTGLSAGLTGLNSNPNSKSHVLPVWNSIPAGLEQYCLNGPSHFFPFLFWFNFKYPKNILNEQIFEKI